MLLADAPLSVEDRLRLVHRCQGRPIAYVVAEMGICRACASKWEGVEISVRTVSRILGRLGLNRRRFRDPAGEVNRAPERIRARRPSHLVHSDIEKDGRIPDVGGWRAHGRGSAQALSADRAERAGSAAATCACTPPSTGSPAWPTPSTCPTRRERPRPGSGRGPDGSSQSTASRRSTASSSTAVSATAPPSSPADSATAATDGSPRPPHATSGKAKRWNRILAEASSTPAVVPQRTIEAAPWRHGTATTTTGGRIQRSGTNPGLRSPPPRRRHHGLIQLANNRK